MNFRDATDALLKSATLEDLAKEMGVSVQAVRQARSTPGTTAYRQPPQGWGKAISKLAYTRSSELAKLARRAKAAEWI